MRPCAGVVLALLPCLGCATASPGLAPVRVLAPSRVQIDVGSAYVAPVSPTALTDARAGGASPSTDLRAAVAYGPTPPGVVSFADVRVGLGLRTEAAVAVVGNLARLGVRTELAGRDENAEWMLTGSAALRAAIPGATTSGVVPGLDLTASQAYGGELGLALGTNRRRIYDLWFRARVGYLHGETTFAMPSVAPQPFDVATDRVEAGGALGVRVGFAHVGVAVELEALYTWVTGSGAGQTSSAGGFALVPAAALGYRF